VLHDLNLAVRFASRVIVLDQGRLVCDGPAAQTVTDTTLGEVFEVADAVGRTPLPGTPFVLPHAAHSIARPASQG
jgi:iron complex transport system ATP-binding protein